MALPSAYLVTTKNLESFFNSLLTAQAPEYFTQKFIENLEFKSSNDRLYISLLKSLGMIDDTGVPTQRYYDFLDQTQSKKVLAEAVKEAYSDLFQINIKANEMTAQEVKNKLKTLTQGKRTDNVLSLMANTFVALCNYADFSNEEVKNVASPVYKEEKASATVDILANSKDYTTKVFEHGLHYNIQIHLPESRDQAVYDAIFKALRDHLK